MEAIGKGWNSRCWRVVGHFRIHLLLADYKANLLGLQLQVELADQANPWVSEGDNEHAPWVLNLKSEREGQVVVFDVSPQFSIYPRQMYAFHRYLWGIAKYLVAAYTDEFAQVYVWMDVHAEEGIAFRTPGGEEIFRLADVAVKNAIDDLFGKK